MIYTVLIEYSYDGEICSSWGNNASGDFPIFYYNGKFDAYQRTYLIQPLSEDTDTKYLYYSIGLKLHRMKANASGTATKFLTQPILNNINIEYRDIEEQKKDCRYSFSLRQSYRKQQQTDETLRANG